MIKLKEQIKILQIGVGNCNSIKLVLMLCVFWSHSMAFWRGDWFSVLECGIQTNQVLTILVNYLSSFHVYAFSLISGFLFFYLIYDCGKYKSFKELFLKKMKRLLIPYCFVSIVWVLPFKYIFWQENRETLFRKIFMGESPDQLWFLLMLFWVFVASYWLKDIYIKHGYLSFGFNIILYTLSIIGGHIFPNFFAVWHVCRHMLFFFIGFKICSLGGSTYFTKLSSWVLITVNVLLYIIWCFAANADGEYFKLFEKLIQLVLRIDGAVSIFVLLERLFRKIHLKTKFVKTMQENSMGLYLFHQQIIYCVLFYFANKINVYINVWLNFIISITISLLIVNLLNKNRWLKVLIGN